MKKYLLFSSVAGIFLLWSFLSPAQTVTGNWFFNSGGDSGLRNNYIMTYPDGSVIEAGILNGTTFNIGSHLINKTGNSTIFLTRISWQGNIMWATQLSCNGEIEIKGLNHDGRNIILTGTFSGTYISNEQTQLTDTLDMTDNDKPFVAVYDDMGSPVSLKNPFPFGQPGKIIVNFAEWDDTGNIFFCGIFSGDSLYAGDVSVRGIPGVFEFFVFGFDNKLNPLWGNANTFDASQGEPWSAIILYGLAVHPFFGVTAYGSYLGSSPIFGSDTLPPANSESQLFIVHFNKEGRYIWNASTQKENNSSILTQLIPANDGGFIASGVFGPGNIDLAGITLSNTTGNDNYFIYRFDVNGNVLWTKEIPSGINNQKKGRTAGDEYLNIVTDDMGNFYAGGYFGADTLRFQDTMLIKRSGHKVDQFIARYHADGTPDWIRLITSGMAHPPLLLSRERDGILVGSNAQDNIYLQNDTIRIESGMNMVYIIGYNTTGDPTYTNRITVSNTGGITLQDFLKSPHNDYYAFGTYSGNIRLNSLSLEGVFNQNYFLTKLSVNTLIKGRVVTSSGTPVTSGNIQLIKLTGRGKAPLEDIITPDSTGSFSLRNFLYGDYLLYTEVDTSKYPNTIGTYLGNAATWWEADTLHAFSDDINLNNINLIELKNTVDGQGIIRGGITAGDTNTKKSTASITGEPIKKVKVILIGTEKSSDNIIAWVYTDDQGRYVFQNIPDGNYKIYVDIPGLPMDSSYSVTISVNNNVISGLDYIVTDELIKLASATGIHLQKTEVLSVKIYPNPTGGRFRISFSGRGAEEITVFDSRGSMVRKFIYGTAVPDQELDLSGMPAGLYYIRVRTGDTTGLGKLVIQR